MVKINLSGKRFGRLTVLHEVKKKNRNRRWCCLCDCGNYTNVDQNLLRQRQSRSCGCLQKEIVSEIATSKIAKKSNIAGKRFGMLTAIKKVGKSKNRNNWLCKCDCGNETIVLTSNLTSGTTKSCGCKGNDGPKNVYPRNNKFRVIISENGNQKYVGTFDTEEQAIKARNQAKLQ
ncbi:hypothetical protein [Oceanobacillus sojae]|uniref:hypothetical protein n=1 Tax=Oceanobacillus sojae TaxID=582851 RepID=UPI0009883C6C|nr:hypothetical protein [Oceanobacillus sojae]